MSFGKKLTDTSALTKGVDPDDKAFDAEIAQQLANTQLAHTLALVRNSVGMTQTQVARELNCLQGKVSKMERGFDEELKFGDIKAFVKATNHRLELVFRRADSTLVDEIKFLAGRMKLCFDRLALLGENDHDIAQGLSKFYQEALYNLVKLVVDNQAKLPKGMESPKQIDKPSVTIEVDDDDTYMASNAAAGELGSA